MDKKNMNRRQRMTVRLLEEAYLELLTEKREANVAVLCERADVNRTTFYRYFRDIEDLSEQMTAGLFDEIFSVLDETRSLSAAGAKSQDNRTVQVHPDCCFIATANIGADYTGTKEIDAAMMNRFFPMELDYLDYKTEANILCARTGISDEDAMNIALVATNIRKDKNSGLLEHSVSTRETLQCAEMVKDGFTVEEALEYTFLPQRPELRAWKGTHHDRHPAELQQVKPFSKWKPRPNPPNPR